MERSSSISFLLVGSVKTHFLFRSSSKSAPYLSQELWLVQHRCQKCCFRWLEFGRLKMLALTSRPRLALLPVTAATNASARLSTISGRRRYQVLRVLPRSNHKRSKLNLLRHRRSIPAVLRRDQRLENQSTQFRNTGILIAWKKPCDPFGNFEQPAQ